MAEIVISWSTLLKAIGGWLLVYFLMPIIMLLREMVILKFVDIAIANKKTQMQIERWAISDYALKNAYQDNCGQGFCYEHGVSYFIGANEVTKSVFDDYHLCQSKHRQIHNELYPVIMSKQRLISKLTKHFELDDYRPVAEEMELALGRRLASARATS
ncbi:hypothetical protein ACWOIF_004284 [Vibrio vulnificus]